MDTKAFFNLHILNASIAKHVLLRSVLLACAISIVSLYRTQSLFNFALIATYLDCVSGFHGIIFRPASQFLRTHFWVPVNCRKDTNLTLIVVSELTGNRLLYPKAKSLFIGEGSSMVVLATKQLGFSTVSTVQMRNFKHKEVLYEDSSFDFVFSRDLDNVSVLAILVLEIERVLKPGGIGTFIVGSSGGIGAFGVEFLEVAPLLLFQTTTSSQPSTKVAPPTLAEMTRSTTAIDFDLGSHHGSTVGDGPWNGSATVVESHKSFPVVIDECVWIQISSFSLHL